MKDAISIFRFLLDAADREKPAALVTITDVAGSSARAPGTHMAVAADGSSIGSFSGGCVEAAVTGEAQRVIGAGKAERLRLGAGSPLIDIRLPCGGSVDLLFLPRPSRQILLEASERLHATEPVALGMSTDGTLIVESGQDGTTGWRGDIFFAGHMPDPKLVILGHGAEVEALAAMAHVHGIKVRVLSPDATIVTTMAEAGAESFLLKTPARSPHLVTDRYTAVAFLFHDHDWETELLAQALEQDSFYIGAMGSRQTHRRRIADLLDRGASVADTQRIVGPAGLIPSARDPQTLAMSILAQVVKRTAARDFHYRNASSNNPLPRTQYPVRISSPRP